MPMSLLLSRQAPMPPSPPPQVPPKLCDGRRDEIACTLMTSPARVFRSDGVRTLLHARGSIVPANRVEMKRVR
jgi:hypothetical protein